MAEVHLTADMSADLLKIIEEIKKTQLSEERIRAIVREEIEAHDNRQLALLRSRGFTGYNTGHEVK